MWLCPSWAGWVGWVVASSWWVKKSWTLQRLFELSLLVHTGVHTYIRIIRCYLLILSFCSASLRFRPVQGRWVNGQNTCPWLHGSMISGSSEFKDLIGFVWATVSNLGFLSRENLSYSWNLWQLLTWDALPFAPAISSYSLLFPDRCFQFFSGIASSCRGSFAILCHPTA